MPLISTKGIAALVPEAWRRILTVRFDKSRIQTIENIIEFIETRAAYVAQTSLYGYLKARMGTRYTDFFQDDGFTPSINNAKWRLYGACLTELSVFAAATAGAAGGLDDQGMEALARHCFDRAIQNTFIEEGAEGNQGDVRKAFEHHLAQTVWPEAAKGENSFSLSPVVLLESAPIATDLKQHDVEIVTNSIRFRWRDVRSQLRRRIDDDAVIADWLALQQLRS